MKRDYPDRPIVGVGAVIVREHRALLVKRSTEPLQGQWSIPGGAVEVGETLRQAIAREVYEETGLVVEVGEVLDVFDSIHEDADGRTRYHYVLIDFLCEPVKGRLCAATDVSEVRWAMIEELDSLQVGDMTQGVIRKAIERFYSKSQA
jgi:8-oxo-dGTP diphosphatase